MWAQISGALISMLYSPSVWQMLISRIMCIQTYAVWKQKPHRVSVYADFECEAECGGKKIKKKNKGVTAQRRQHFVS